ncbi:MAG: hypothetical protein MdMp014T_2822 [Treponematales bacterium]
MKKNNGFILVLLVTITAVCPVLAGCDYLYSLLGGTDNGDQQEEPDDGETETGAGEGETGEEETGGGEVPIADITFTAAANSTFHQGKGTTSSSIYDIAYGNGKFVAVGIAGQIAYSTDGSTWTAAKNNGFRLSDSKVEGVIYGGNKFVAWGSRDSVISNGRITTWRDVVYSSDGVYWTRANSANLTEEISDIAYGSGKFVAVSAGQMAYSSNGSTWTLITDSALEGISFSSITYGAGMFIAVGSSGRTAYSSDGITWTVLIGAAFNGITYSGGKFIAWGGGVIASSSDGITWKPLVNDTFSGWPSGIIYGAGKFVSWSGNDVNYSMDGGVIWKQVDSTLTEGIRNIAYGNGVFVAVGGNWPGQIAYSNKQE